jgi:DNA repair protein RecO (recombination protein O)
MLQTTSAVVLRTVRHTDKSLVLRAYTERSGLRSYMVRTVAKGGDKLAALQPLSRIELVVPEAGEQEMPTVRELRIERPYTRVVAEPVRGVLLLFAQEVFNRTLREESADDRLYAFVQEALEEIDRGTDIAHQPVRLLVGLARHLGFSPEAPSQGEDRFDLREGCFFRGQPPHEFCMDPLVSSLFATLVAAEAGVDAPPQPGASLAVRRRLLEDLLLYYRFHVDGFGQLRSLDVLRSVLE